MGRPFNLNAARALKEGDARLQSVADALEDVLSQCEEYGWTKAYIILHRPDGDGYFRTDCRIAGCTTLEARGLLFSQIKEDIIEDV